MHKVRIVFLKIYPIGLIIVAITIFHWPGIRPEYTFLPVDLANNNYPWLDREPKALQNWLISDPLYQFYPFLTRSIDSIRNGSLLLWDHTIYLGHPAFSDPLYQTFYPLLIPFLYFFGVAKGLALGLFCHIILAALFTYLLLRKCQYSRAAAVSGALIYALSGYLVTWFETPFWTTTIALLPGILLTFLISILSRRILYTACSGLLLGLAILAGQFQFMMLFLCLIWIYVLGFVFLQMIRKKRVDWLPAISLLLLCVVGILLSGIQAVPFFEFLQRTRRELDSGLSDPLALRQLLTLIIPNYFGNPTVGPYWGASNYSESTMYASTTGLLLALTVFVHKEKSPIRTVSILAILVLYFIVGGFGVSFFSSLPLIKYISLHRSGFIVPLFIAILSAHAINREKTSGIKVSLLTLLCIFVVASAWIYRSHDAPRQEYFFEREFVLSVSFILLTCLLLILRRFNKPWVQWAFPLLIIVELIIWGRGYNPVGKIKKLTPITPMVEFLNQNTGFNARIMALQRDNKLIFGPNILGLYNQLEPGGYSSFVNENYYQIVEQADPEIDVDWANRAGNMILFSRPTSRLLDFMNVEYLVTSREIADTGPKAEFVNSGCVSNTPEITKSAAVSGTFLVQNTAINRFDVEYSVGDFLVENETIFIKIWRNGDQMVQILETGHTVADVIADLSQTVYFAPEKEAIGHEYTWSITTDALHTGISVCITEDTLPAVSSYGIEHQKVFEDGEIKIYQRFTQLPYAYVVYSVQNIPENELAIQSILNEDFDIRNIGIAPEGVDLHLFKDAPGHSASFLTLDDHKIEIHTVAKQEGMLIISNQYHRGWKATVNGESTNIHRVNHIYQGIELEKGENSVTLLFQPQSLRIGIGVTLSGLLLFVALVVFDLLRNKSHLQHHPAHRKCSR